MEAVSGDLLEILRGIAQHVFGTSALIERGQKVDRNLGMGGSEQRGSLRDGSASCGLFSAVRTIDRHDASRFGYRWGRSFPDPAGAVESASLNRSGSKTLRKTRARSR